MSKDPAKLESMEKAIKKLIASIDNLTKEVKEAFQEQAATFKQTMEKISTLDAKQTKKQQDNAKKVTQTKKQELSKQEEATLNAAKMAEKSLGKSTKKTKATGVDKRRQEEVALMNMVLRKHKEITGEMLNEVKARQLVAKWDKEILFTGSKRKQNIEDHLSKLKQTTKELQQQEKEAAKLNQVKSKTSTITAKIRTHRKQNRWHRKKK